MSTVLTVLVTLVFVALAGGTGFLWLRLHETARREALQAVAARRGWALTINEEKLGRPGVLRLMPRGGSGWVLTAHRHGTELEAVTRGGERSEFAADEPRWPDGCLVIAPPSALPHSETSLSTPVTDNLLSAIGVRPEMHRHRNDLTIWPAPETVTILGSGDPVPRFDLGDIAKFHAGWGGNPNMRPVVVIDPDGLRLYLTSGLRRAEQMERFIDFALEAARTL